MYKTIYAIPSKAIRGIFNFTSRSYSLRKAFKKSTMSGEAYARNKFWSKDTVAVVTGGNRGIGYDIAALLAKQGLTTVLTARNETLGLEAVKKLKSEEGVTGDIVFMPLDITKKDSIQAFSKRLKNEFGGLDILINNAGIAYKGDVFGPEEALATLNTNYFGTADLTEALTPCFRKPGSARVVIISSSVGRSGIIKSAQLLEKLTAATSRAELDVLAFKFIEGIKSGTYAEEGWPKSMYCVSKLLISLYTRLMAPKLAQKGIEINCCCPGYCATDMTSWKGVRPSRDGADTPVWLALRDLDHNFGSGLFYSDREPRQL